MAHKVADVRGNPNENVVHAADVIGRSVHCRTVFAAIYRGKKKIKTVRQLMDATHLTQKQVLTQGKKLADNEIVTQVKVDGQTGYEKDDFFSQRKNKVLTLVDNPKNRSKYPTKQEPRGSRQAPVVKIRLQASQSPPERVTVDDIDSFSAVKDARPSGAPAAMSSLPEKRVKRFLQKVLGETKEFRDWGGERNDLYTDRLRFKGNRRAAAFALKGRATTGALTPKKMGKNGDQIGRLFLSEAQVFFVVYHSKIDEAVAQQMYAHAAARALTGARVYYCLIDGDDLARLAAAYPSEFAASA
jgi:hypothetical protein